MILVNTLVPKVEGGMFEILCNNKFKYKKYYDKNTRVKGRFDIGQKVV